MTPRVKGKVGKGGKLSLWVPSISVKQEMKTSRENVVNRGKEGTFLRERKA